VSPTTQLPPALAHPSDELETVGEGVGVTDGAGAKVGDGVELAVGAGDWEGVADAVVEGDALGEAEAVEFGVAVGVAFGEGLTLATGFSTTTPLFQTGLPLTLMHVYFFPFTVEVLPTLLHVAPILTAPCASDTDEINKPAVMAITSTRRNMVIFPLERC